MKVILTQSHFKLGSAGDVITVKDGYARNYLIPRKFAIPATPGNMKQVEQIRRRQMTIEQKRKEKMQILAEKLSRVSVDLVVEVDEEDKLFGTVTTGQIADALQRRGFDIDRKQIIIDEPIDSLGVYNVKIDLHPEVECAVRVWILKHEH
ncbi:50S ribosomal protein L9 [bacterium]|nr:50S ribosomal protein L9 [bacterium]RKZ27469.1 MAG: 50S ribosomal protein L9 [bacterium]